MFVELLEGPTALSDLPHLSFSLNALVRVALIFCSLTAGRVRKQLQLRLRLRLASGSGDRPISSPYSDHL